MMRLAPMLLFLHVSVLSAAPPIGKPGARGDKAKAKPKGGVIPTGVDPSEYAKAAHDATCQCYLMSCTITPQPRARGGGFTPDDCFEACEDWMQDLNTEFALRMGDGHVQCFIISLERGEDLGNSHLQCYYVLCSCIADAKQRIEAERKWIRPTCVNANDVPCRVNLLHANLNDKAYCFGYCTKDENLDHFRTFYGGITAEDLKHCKAVYLAKVAAAYAQTPIPHRLSQPREARSRTSQPIHTPQHSLPGLCVSAAVHDQFLCRQQQGSQGSVDDQ